MFGISFFWGVASLVRCETYRRPLHRADNAEVYEPGQGKLFMGDGNPLYS